VFYPYIMVGHKCVYSSRHGARADLLYKRKQVRPA